ncbi:MAG: hypothetical protein AB8F74_12170 [Saprospiraceae bacterium]
MRYLILLAFSLLISCNSSKPSKDMMPPSPKITFDLSKINDDGLAGNGTGQVAVDYEFCIPASEGKATAVKVIDSSLRVMKKGRGRIGCTDREWLCIGSTHQKNWRKVLNQLTKLDYVKQINQTFYE